MAAFTENAAKLAGIAAALPFVAVAAGYRLRFVQAKETSGSGVRRVYRVCDLPVYSVADMGELKCGAGTPYPRNPVEAGIGIVRRTMQDFFREFLQFTENTMKITIRTSLSTTVATYKHLRENTEDCSRAALTAGAGIGGFMLGRKSNPWRGLSYGLLATVPCGIVCYPSKLMQLCQLTRDFVRDTWQSNLWKRLEMKYSQGEHRQASRMSMLHTSENFDTISVSDLYDIEKFRTIDLCTAENTEKISTVDCCNAESAENFSTVDSCNAEIIEELSTGDICSVENEEAISTIECSNAENTEKLDKVDCCNAENTEKLDNVDCCNIENTEKLDKVDCCNAETTEKLDKVDCSNTENTEKLSMVDCIKAESKEKLKIVKKYNVKRTEKKRTGSNTDQSTPEDKDLYSTRSS